MSTEISKTTKTSTTFRKLDQQLTMSLGLICVIGTLIIDSVVDGLATWLLTSLGASPLVAGIGSALTVGFTLALLISKTNLQFSNDSVRLGWGEYFKLTMSMNKK